MNFVGNLLFRGLLIGCILCFFASTSATAESITIAGTGDSQHLLRELAKTFERQYPGKQIQVPNSVGSGGGIKLLQAGRVELARIARPLKPKEQEEGLQHRIFAYSPVVFVANLPEPCLQSISAHDYLDIISGKTTNWNQLGDCPDHKIYVANREDGDSSKEVIDRHIPAARKITTLVGRTIYSTPEAYETLNRYPYSFGYLPQAEIHKDNLTMLAFEGVSASKENVQQGHYELTVPLGIAWRGQPSGLTKTFLDFLFSSEARELMLKINSIPAPAE